MSGGRLHVMHDIDRPNWDQSKWPYYLNASFCLSDSCIAYVQAIFLSYARAGDLFMTALKRNSFKHYSLQRFYCVTSFKSLENNIATVEHAKRSIIWVFAIISHQFVCSIRKQFRHAHSLSNQNLLIIIIAAIQLYWWLNGPFLIRRNVSYQICETIESKTIKLHKNYSMLDSNYEMNTPTNLLLTNWREEEKKN